MPSALDDILARLDGAPEREVAAIRDQVLARTKQHLWVPNPGPQTDAYFSEADQLLYGGEVGGGKTDLLVGLALDRHFRSLILRRINKEVEYLVERTEEIVGNRDGYNGQKGRWHRPNGGLIQFGGCQYPGDEKGYKGDPKDFIGIDEASEFLESQVDFVLGWLRTSRPGQQCRVVFATNPPTTAEGEWITRWFAPWVDKTHPLYPYPQGKLLWFVRDGEHFRWLESPDEVEVDGRMVKPMSRTFIRSGLSDNPDYAETGYADRIALLPEELRKRYAEGDFSAGMKDSPWQAIPSEWARLAQERWTDYPPKGIPMCAIGADVAQGGDDNNVIAIRYDGWFAPLMVLPGKETPVGKDIAGVLVTQRRDNAEVVIDCGGGYGGSAYKTLKDNGISVHAYRGSEKSFARTHDRTLGFANLRTEAWWKFREALDPAVEGGSTIALPHDQRLLADLTAPTFEEVRGQIKLEPKDKLIKRLGRSTDFGDAVVMAWWKGGRISSDYGIWQGLPGVRSKPKVILGHQAARRRR